MVIDSPSGVALSGFTSTTHETGTSRATFSTIGANGSDDPEKPRLHVRPGGSVVADLELAP